MQNISRNHPFCHQKTMIWITYKYFALKQNVLLAKTILLCSREGNGGSFVLYNPKPTVITILLT